jgi:hypothetical protein
MYTSTEISGSAASVVVQLLKLFRSAAEKFYKSILIGQVWLLMRFIRWVIHIEDLCVVKRHNISFILPLSVILSLPAYLEPFFY